MSSSPEERALREAVSSYAQRLHTRGWVANHDGNLTARLERQRFLATPTAISKAATTPSGLIVVDENGQLVSGQARPFSEIGLHLAVYRERPDVSAVVHAHPPAATAIACAGSGLLERVFIAEAVVSLGETIPTVPFAPPGQAAALAPFARDYDVVLAANHGVFAWGRDVEQAYLRLELVEHLARIALEAERIGGVRPLPETALPALLEARRKAGLGAKPTVVACALPPSDAPVNVCAPGTNDLAAIIREELAKTGSAAPSDDLAIIIREELARALGK